MKKTFSILIALASICAITGLIKLSPEVLAAGTEKTATVVKTVSIGRFNAIETELSIEVRVNIGKAGGKAVITAKEEVMPYIECEVNGGTLEVGLKSNVPSRFNMGKVVIEVSTPTLKNLSAETSGIINVNGDLSFEDFEAEVETSGKIILKGLDGESVTLNAETSGSIICGDVKCVDFESDVETSGSIALNRLECSEIEIDAETSGKITVLAGSARTCDLSADTNGLISIAGMSIGSGSASADTGGKIIASITNPEVSTDTGGRVNLK